ncbi:hypothetical protein ACCI36_004177 [Vibrio parahaemolyticus]
MSNDNTSPPNHNEPTSAEINDSNQNPEGLPIPRDIRSDNLDPATKGEASHILKFNIFEKRTYLFFKVTAFIVIILLGAYFLCTGLTVSVKAITHIKDIQVKQLQHNSAKVELAKLIELNKVDKAKLNASPTVETSSLPVSSSASVLTDPASSTTAVKGPETEPRGKATETIPAKEKVVKVDKNSSKESDSSLSSAMVSTGSIVTLIAFILGVGLTLLLTLLKITFTANEPTNQSPNDCVTVAGPLSELLQSIAEYIKKKIGLS